MWNYLLQQILQRTLTIPIAWGAVYPTLTGNVVAKNVVLVAPAAVETSAETDDSITESSANQVNGIPVATIKYLKVSPVWSTAMADTVDLSWGEVRGLTALVDLADPSGILRCLQNRLCLPPEVVARRRARLLARSAPQVNNQPENSEPGQPMQRLALRIASFDLSDSEIIVKRNQQLFVFKIVRGQGGPFAVPLDATGFEVRVDVLARESGSAAEDAGERWHPLKALVRWDGGKERLELAVSLHKFPLADFQKLFPELDSEAVAFQGNLSGELTLEFDAKRPAGAQWRLL